MTAIWSRNTTWRQGSVLSVESAHALGLAGSQDSRGEASESDTFYIAISHDCDIAHDDLAVEPDIEFMCAKLADGERNNFADAQNARKLRIYLEELGVEKDVELKIRDRVSVKKDVLVSHTPDVNFKITGKQLITLQWWLSARYLRAAFSNSFEERLERVKSKIARALRDLVIDVVGIYFKVDDGSNLELENSQVHELRVQLVYQTSVSDERRELVSEAAKKIQDLFIKVYKPDKIWQEIELVGNCDIVSAKVFSYDDQRSFKRWRLDHRSLQINAELPSQG